MSDNLPYPTPDPSGPSSADLPPVEAPGVERPAVEPPERPEPPEVEPVRRVESTRVRPGAFTPARLSLIVVAFLVGSALFVGGYSLGSHVALTPGTQASEESRFGAFWDVYRFIQRDYAGSPRPSLDQLAQGAIKGMLESLNDTWSYYQGPEDFSNSLQNVGGQAQGIGVLLQLQSVDPSVKQNCQSIGNGCELAVAQVIPGSPAEKAGVQTADVLSAVDGQALAGKSFDQATALIKGASGTKVTIVFLRKGQPVTLTITRGVFNRPEVTYRSLPGGVAYIQIAQNINDPAASQLEAALKQANAAGQKRIVLDLRGNLGGYVESAEKMSSEFISSGPLLYQQGATGDPSEVDATPGGLATDPEIKIVVLVDGNTASAAEIIAGALQSRGRAELVGTKTYGKGVVQAWLPLPDNFGGVHLTIARWLTPDHIWIQGKGLQPNVPVDTSNVRAGTDPVLDAGLAQLGAPPTSTASGSPAPASPPPPSATPAPAAS